MTEKARIAVLKAAIEKAQEKGFILQDNKHMVALDHSGIKPMLGYESIIFSHSFAKSFFGTARIITMNGRLMEAWQYQLQRMVLSEDPIEFLNDFLV